MQIQKEEVRNSIIQSAMEEFYNHGYEKASLRKIVKGAGTTIGNFYNYFKNKEELFMVISKPAYDGFLHFMEGHDESEDMEELLELELSLIRGLISQHLRGIDDNFQKSLVILLDGSKGTKYENVKDNIVKFLSEHFMDHLLNSPNIDNSPYNNSFAYTAAIGFLEGFLNILRGDYNSETRERLIADYILFFALGTNEIINKFEQ